MNKKKKVLIIDDDKVFSDELKMMFEMRNGEDGYEFEISQAINLDEACYCLKGYPLNWDVFIIDRKFSEKRNGNDFWAATILESLLDLGAKGLKIVLTAYPEEENMKRCFQLGAWDYIDKKSTDEETCFEKTIKSTIQGLKFKERFKELDERYQNAHDWFNNQNLENLKELSGKFVALKLVNEENNEWEVMKNDKEESFARDSLYRLYGDLDMFYKETKTPWENKKRRNVVIISIPKMEDQ